MKVRLRPIFSFFLTLVSTLSFAQDENVSAVSSLDSLKVKSGLEVSLDYGKILTLLSDSETKAEGTIGYMHKEKLQILVEIGYAKLTPPNAIVNGEYTSKGIYGRGGLAYGGEIVPKSYLYIGAMYATSQFEDGGKVLIESQAWEDINEDFSRTDLRANWFEIILITEQKLNEHLFLGSKLRFRKLLNFPDDYTFEVYYIPGYGRTYNNAIPAINLYIKYRIGF